MNNENKLKRTYQNTDIKLLNWIEISDDRREFRMETTRINQRDGEAVVKVEHMVNGIIMIESIKTVPLSAAIGAEVQDKLTMAEIQDAEAGHEMNKQEENRVTCEITSNLIEKENEQLSIDDIQTEEKKQPVIPYAENPVNVNEDECPEWLGEKKYFYEAARLGFIRPYGCGNTWTKEQIKEFYIELYKILKKHEKNMSDWELQDDMLILMLRIRRDFTNIIKKENVKFNSTHTPVKIIKNVYKIKVGNKTDVNYSEKWHSVLYSKDLDKKVRDELTKNGDIPAWSLKSNKMENYEAMRTRYGIKYIA